MADIEVCVLRQLNLPIQSRIIWQHKNLPLGRVVSNSFISSYDFIFHCGNHKLNFPENWGEERFDVQVFARPQSQYADTSVHETAKPLKLIQRFIELGSKDGDTVLDPFAGSGVTGEACNLIGNRQCILIEQEPNFIEVIKERCPNANR